jgi:hypothetical protein
MGGVFVVNGGAQVSGTIDVNQAGTFVTNAMTGSISTAPDANGRGQIVFSPANPQPTRTFTFYIVNSKVLRFIEDDGVDYTGGSAYAQGTAGTAALSGNYVYRHAGWTATSRIVAAGEFAASGGSVTSGLSDANTYGSPSVPATGKPVSGTYAFTTNLDTTVSGTATLTDAAGASTFNVYVVDPTLNILDPNNASGTGGALLLHTDAAVNGTGLVLPQSATGISTLAGNYAVKLKNSIAGTTPDELDLVGVGTASSGVFANGLADYDEDETFNAPTMFGAVLTGTFAADGAHVGHSTGAFTVTPPTSGYVFVPGTAAPTTIGVSIYQASAAQAFVVETDATASVDGMLVLQQLP